MSELFSSRFVQTSHRLYMDEHMHNPRVTDFDSGIFRTRGLFLGPKAFFGKPEESDVDLMDFYAKIRWAKKSGLIEAFYWKIGAPITGIVIRDHEINTETFQAFSISADRNGSKLNAVRPVYKDSGLAGLVPVEVDTTQELVGDLLTHFDLIIDRDLEKHVLGGARAFEISSSRS